MARKSTKSTETVAAQPKNPVEVLAGYRGHINQEFYRINEWIFASIHRYRQDAENGMPCWSFSAIQTAMQAEKLGRELGNLSYWRFAAMSDEEVLKVLTSLVESFRERLERDYSIIDCGPAQQVETIAERAGLRRFIDEFRFSLSYLKDAIEAVKAAQSVTA